MSEDINIKKISDTELEKTITNTDKQIIKKEKLEKELARIQALLDKFK